jgi:hypothetical protein
MKWRILFAFLLMAALSSQSFAATYSLNPSSSVISTVAAAKSGDTVLLGAGTYNLSSPINVPNGVTVSGISPDSTHVIFNLPGGEYTSYGFVVNGNSSNVTLQNMDMISNHGLITMRDGSGYNNITISYNNFQYGGGQLPNGTFIFGIYGTILNNNLQMTHNYFHDSTVAGSRNWCIWFAQNSNIDYNLFYNIVDGGQICDCGQNLSFSHNYGTMINRMGQEAGLDSNSSMTIDGNVFYNWNYPYDDSDALSIVGVSGQINYTNNFFQASIAPGSSWGPGDNSGFNRFGLAIEGTGRPAVVSGNTWVGTWACDYSSTMVNAQVYNNTVWGGALWGDFDGEPGPNGNGSVNAYNNTLHSSASGAPAPPVNTFAGPNFGGGAVSAPATSSDPASSAPTSSAPTSSAPTSSGGSLSGSLDSAASSYNLTELGSSDWDLWQLRSQGQRRRADQRHHPSQCRRLWRLWRHRSKMLLERWYTHVQRQ